MKWVDKDSTRKVSSSIDDVSVYLFNVEQKQSRSSLKYQVRRVRTRRTVAHRCSCDKVLESTTLDVVLLVVDGQTKKIDVRLSDVSMHINPILLQMINSFVKSTDKSQEDEKKDTRDLRSIFMAQPLEHSSFLFLQSLIVLSARHLSFLRPARRWNDQHPRSTRRHHRKRNCREDEKEKTSPADVVREQVIDSVRHCARTLSFGFLLS